MKAKKKINKRQLTTESKDLLIIIVVVVTVFIMSYFFNIFEFKKETAKRIRLQEELTNIANTKAMTEEIISRQLRVEIEERKQMGLK